MCSGKTGDLTPKAMAKAAKSQTAVEWLIAVARRAASAKVSSPPAWCWCRTARYSRPTKRKADPAKV